jgi:hypothetical protein
MSSDQIQTTFAIVERGLDLSQLKCALPHQCHIVFADVNDETEPIRRVQ